MNESTFKLTYIHLNELPSLSNIFKNIVTWELINICGKT